MPRQKAPRTAPPSSPGGSSARTAPARKSSSTAVVVSLGKRIRGVNRNFVLLLSITLFLVAFGIVMVLSSSSVEEFAGGNAVSSRFVSQATFAALGIPLMLFASRMPLSFWKRSAWAALAVAIILQALVFTPIGVDINGNRAWINLGFTTMQPAEVVKVALVLWLGLIIGRKQGKLHIGKEVAVPIVPVLLLCFGIMLLSKDLGTIIVVGALVLGALYFGGVATRYLLLALAVAVAGAVLMSVFSDNRMARITNFFGGDVDYESWGWQSAHGLYALAAGGLFGSGLGNSKAKWSWLPEADNDFIFAIIGEELGLVGAIVVIGLFVLLAVVLVRIYHEASDWTAKTIVGGVLTWIVFQAFVNIAVVIGFLPVLGVPLPLVSSGGSALITTLFAIGIVLSIARNPKRSESRT
ncbi:putative lipid II flippase FtsW [Pseudoclavibacter sp. RFBJ3]|uniref:putative lipid II flippase FtsW n=1 Tax=unclassified Pseudoclavibacter TaxID=2615177 RepID=UPI000CE7FA5E|nr:MULTISPECIES: putative lipid II flippase FtsW [unclassified Pseudoclavibacter]MBF4548939.1 putative lipid II flippase FtsW [Pseudoclavibacter sp. VKM Ac-2888]PPF40274.1 putative lipid II flippase FtsW [Pseudoclavibacter sp. AY1H1]PPF84324.1 putative lipid II flippase FtsW [Pseudoclavibacter sp. RFBJ5]PPF92776.1 putative lipid II flippase FtsW [Pseudoclavibacter sp. RFBJ3]PPF98152.1 putative lipid II flippase FtsW [Pseudoclavibacter sp. RFBH5]